MRLLKSSSKPYNIVVHSLISSVSTQQAELTHACPTSITFQTQMSCMYVHYMYLWNEAVPVEGMVTREHVEALHQQPSTTYLACGV